MTKVEYVLPEHKIFLSNGVCTPARYVSLSDGLYGEPRGRLPFLNGGEMPAEYDSLEFDEP